MATPNQEAIDTFIGITGATAAAAARKLEEHGGNLNEAVNAYFSEGDRNTSVNVHETPVLVQDDFMDIDDPDLVGSHRNPLPLLAAARDINPFSYLENLDRSVFESSTDITNRTPFVTHPREVREIPIEVKDGSHSSGHSDHAPKIDDATGTAEAYGPGVSGTVIVDDDDDDVAAAPTVRTGQGSGPRDNSSGDGSHHQTFAPSAPRFDDPSNDIEEQMIRAAIEASKREVEANHSNHQFGVPNEFDDIEPEQRQSHLEDPELAHVVSLSLKTAEQEKAFREQGGNVRPTEMVASKEAEVELAKVAAPNGSLEAGSSSIRDDTEDVEEQPLVRHRSRRMPPGSVESSKEFGPSETSTPSSPGEQDMGNHPSHVGSAFPSDEWGGMSSQEHDEAVMLEAAMFGGIPEGSGYRIPYAPHQFMRPESPYPLPVPRPPSPSLTAQRMIREQQDDEYLASLQADREKELKAIEEAEARREAERQEEEESRRKVEEEQELERQLAAKEATLPQEPASDDVNAVTLLVRMPDGSRHGRRFLKTDKLQSLFNFIDIGRRVKPGSYRVVRPFPRRAFSDGDSALTLNELGLTSKQEALFWS
ncbi:putative UBX domain-containing protein 2/7 [Rosa chinensis]|uniref:Putative UBX domain-containing protein 2/7 n=1 Tax=Rosa chinensis TaxID=74649 RepID=A0A2P6P7A3_ROSCH|nr:plant UBX domain-containing protein 8 [Rosa chinensis]PRQ17818.1 putative UBX domain-containing protein 2/7 [Rosa chinensis]